MGLKVFISYATADSKRFQIAKFAAKLLEYQGVGDVLYWEKDAHDDIFKYMNDNLGSCDVLIIFCSPDAMGSESVEMEWMAAIKLKKLVIPVFENDQDIPPLLTTKIGVLFDNKSLKKTIDSVYDVMMKKQKGERKNIPVNLANGENFDFEELTKLAAQAIFNNQSFVNLKQNTYPVKKFSKTQVRYIHIGSYKIYGAKS